MKAKVVRRNKMELGDKLVALLIFVHYAVYEVVFFFWTDFAGGKVAIATMIWKLVFPFGLLVYAGLPDSRKIAGLPHLRLYIVAFGVFLGWAAVSCLLSESGAKSLIEWLKLLPRVLFFIGIVSLALTKPQVIEAVLKVFVTWCLLAVFQYAILVLSASHGNTTMFAGIPGTFAGPLGILGNVTATMSFPGLPWPITRLCGFWNEPSNASASLFAAFFVARGFYIATAKLYWRVSSYALVIGGLLCLSNAGYLALAVGLLFGAVFGSKGGRMNALSKVLTTVAAVGFLFVGAFGRGYVMTHMPDNELARAFVGVRGDVDDIKSGALDAYGGRIMLLSMAIDTIKARPQGVGLTVGGDSGMDTLSASAPVMWLTLTGGLGLLLLLLRESAVAAAAVRHASQNRIGVAAAQAWLVVCVQHCSYGSWMNPLYFICVTWCFFPNLRVAALPRYNLGANRPPSAIQHARQS